MAPSSSSSSSSIASSVHSCRHPRQICSERFRFGTTHLIEQFLHPLYYTATERQNSKTARVARLTPFSNQSCFNPTMIKSMSKHDFFLALYNITYPACRVFHLDWPTLLCYFARSGASVEYHNQHHSSVSTSGGLVGGTGSRHPPDVVPGQQHHHGAVGGSSSATTTINRPRNRLHEQVKQSSTDVSSR